MTRKQFLQTVVYLLLAVFGMSAMLRRLGVHGNASSASGKTRDDAYGSSR